MLSHLGLCSLLPALALSRSIGQGRLRETMDSCIQNLEMWESSVRCWDEGHLPSSRARSHGEMLSPVVIWDTQFQGTFCKGL